MAQHSRDFLPASPWPMRALQKPREPEEFPRFNLFLPASHCPACKTPLKAWHNIPVVCSLAMASLAA
ncbi:prepilin peptidase [Mycobacterium tuberculosis]|uniref:prepilin peptidase n=1 Tax=Mycobacterium tuberculosis TaxID=1773 RepID=UPI003510D19D